MSSDNHQITSEKTVVFDNVSKRYSKYSGIQKIDLFFQRLKRKEFNKNVVKEEDFYALKNLSFALNPGERLGFIGRNGAGKSTALKLVNKIVYPTYGKIHTQGQVGGLLELGAGFNAELTGRENIYINGAILGFNRKEVERIMDTIISISELDTFIDVPIKKYSSGMKIRLGFALVMATSPDVVLLDEVLAVGDANFRKKSTQMMQDYLEGKTLVFVSHSLGQIKEICSRVIVLEKGEVFFDGPTDDAIQEYKGLLESRQGKKKTELVPEKKEIQKNDPPLVTVSECYFQDDDSNQILHGENLQGRIELDFNEISGPLQLTINVKKKIINNISEILDYSIVDIEAKYLKKNKAINFRVKTQSLLPGQYLLEFLPLFKNQAATIEKKTFRKDFSISSRDQEEYKGILDLKIKLDVTAAG